MMSTEEFDLARDTFFVNSKPATSAIQKISRSPTKHKKATGGFGTSARKTSKFSVLDPLNFPVQTPGPGTYITHKDWSPRSGKVTDNLEEINLLKYLSQESLSPIISFPRNTEIEDHEPSSKNNGRVTKFSTSNGERGLWQPKNIHHPYRLPSRGNPGPGFYNSKNISNGIESSWPFKSQTTKLSDMITNVPGPGSYEPKTNNKLPEFTNFGTKRLRQCSLENYTSEAPPVGLYSPKSDKNSHAATYVFNSETERLNASIDFTVGPGNYEANCDNHQQFSFNKTDRFKFDFFRGKLGVGPAHYRLKSKEKSKTVAVEAKAKRFAPLDRQNPDFYAVSINENSSIVGITSLPIKNYNAKAPFNSSDIRFPYARDYWIKKTGAPDPGHYSLDKNDVKPKFFESKIPRFVETLKSEGPGPGAYEVRSNPLKS